MKRILCALTALCLLVCGTAFAGEIVLPVLVAQLGKAAIPVDRYEVGDEYTEVLAVDPAVVVMGRYAGEKPAEEIAAMYGDDFYDIMPLEGSDMVSERRMCLYNDGMTNWVIDTSVIHLDGYTYGFSVVVDENEYFGYLADEPYSEQVDWWVSTLDVFDGTPAAEEEVPAPEEISAIMIIDCPLFADAQMVFSEAYEDGSYANEYISGDGNVRIGEYAMAAPGADEPMEDALYAAALSVQEDAVNFTWYEDAELSQKLDWPAYQCGWTAGDLRARALVVNGPRMLMLFAQTGQDVFRNYEPAIIEMFGTVELFADEAAVDVSGIVAEEIAYAFFGDYAAFNYVWDEIFDGEYYSVYEFSDEDEWVVGTVAVHPQTGHAYISIGTDALEPNYEEVIVSEDGYEIEPGVG